MNQHLKNHVFASLPSAGLGNRLFPWARARVYSELHGLPMLQTRWWQVKLGPWLRREKDSRLYLSQFQSLAGEVGGIRRICLLAKQNFLEEPKDLAKPPEKVGIVRFTGWGDYFTRLENYADIVRRDIHSAVHPHCRKQIIAHSGDLPEIGFHVRRGDFRVANTNSQFRNEGGLQTPMEWYSRILREIRNAAGRDVPAFVVSDGSDEDLRPLLEAKSVRRIDTGSAIGDLVILSKSKLLVGAGGSSFSAWGAFLGNTPVLTCEGQSLSWFGLTNGIAGGLVATVSLEKVEQKDLQTISIAVEVLRNDSKITPD